MQTEQARKFVWIIREKGCFHHWVKVAFLLFVRAKPCLPLWSFSLIRKTELWKTNKPPAMQVSQHCFSLQKKTSGGIINVGSPTALIYTGGIHMDNNSLSHTKWNCKYHIGATWRSLFEMRFNAIISIRDIPTTKCPVSDERCEAVGQSRQVVSTSAQLPGMDAQG